MTEKILAAIKELREKAKKRNFVQSFDLIVNLKEINLKKPENRFSEELFLPHGRGKEAKVVLFSDTIRDANCEILTSDDIRELGKNKRAAKKLARKTDFFLAEPKLMPLIGKMLGQFLAPRGKMPKIVTEDAKTLVEKYKKAVRIKVKESPVVQCIVGNEKMKDEEIAENIKAVLKFLENKLPKGKNNIQNVLVKLTMSAPVKIEV